MRFSTLAFAACCATALALWNTTETYYITKTDYTTVCPGATTFTISTCESHVCHPHTYTASEETTVTVTGECIVPTSISVVTDYTTFCPYATTFTVTKCENHHCGEVTYTAEGATTITVTGECVSPTAPPTTTAPPVTPLLTHPLTTYVPSPTTVTYTTCNGKTCLTAVVPVSTETTITLPTLPPTNLPTVAAESVTISSFAGAAGQSVSGALAAFVMLAVLAY